MIIRDFTTTDYQAMVDIHNSLNIAWPERPRTAHAWEIVDKNRNPEHPFKRWVAIEAGVVVGFGTYRSTPWDYPPGSFHINIEVRPGYHRRGVGAALYDRVISALEPFNPPSLRADAYANLPQGFRFLEKRGFYEAFRETPVHLDLSSFDAAPYVRLEPGLRSKGIVIKTLGELETDPMRDRKLYELYWTVDPDMPHEGEGVKPPPFEDWLRWGINDPCIKPDAYFIATEGGKYVGLRELGIYPGADTLMGGLLGVLREYRNRGIGLALQLRGIAYARAHGYRLLKTCTAVQNIPMQALFNKLGYDRDPEWQQCQKDLR